MAMTVNKRAQARNERALEDLIRNVPGNDRCADCAARNPGWASWSLGIFLCMRCAALHRKLGVHISKVKSLSMDTWTGEQVEQMKTTGNTLSNKTFNPRGTRPNLPLDADEIDTAMEKFIRAKYQARTLAAPAVQLPHRTSSQSHLGRTDTGSTGSSDDRPPQVPAKDTPRFGSGFRAASSTVPSGGRERPLPPVRQTQALEAGRPPDDEALGLSSQEEGLRRLKSMGFANEKKNASVLKGVNNDITGAVEALVRLGEGGHGSETIRTQMLQPQRAQTSERPLPSMPTQNGAGYQIQPMQPLSQQQTGRSSSTSSSTPNWNPFMAPTQQLQTSPQATPPIEAAFQSLNITQQQPVSQHSTGSYYMQQHHQQNPFYSTYTPPISPSPYQQQPPNQHQQNVVQQNGLASNPFLRTSRSQNFNDTTGMYPAQEQPPSFDTQNAPPVPSLPSWAQPQQQHRSFSQPQLVQPQATGMNFFSQSQAQQPQNSQQQASQQLYTQSSFHSPRVQSPLSQQTSNASEYFSQQTPQNVQGHQQEAQAFNQNAWYTNGQSQPQQSEQLYHQPQSNQHPYQPQPPPYPQSQQFQHPPQLTQPQPTGRYDKASILSLYNNIPSQPQVQPQQPQRSLSMPLSSINGHSQPQSQPQLQPRQQQQQLPSQTQPQPQSQQQQTQPWNPFGSTVNGAAQRPSLGHIREESRDFIYGNGAAGGGGGGGGGGGMNGGRHSPDAFSGLSARFR